MGAPPPSAAVSARCCSSTSGSALRASSSRRANCFSNSATCTRAWRPRGAPRHGCARGTAGVPRRSGSGWASAHPGELIVVVEGDGVVELKQVVCFHVDRLLIRRARVLEVVQPVERDREVHVRRRDCAGGARAAAGPNRRGRRRAGRASCALGGRDAQSGLRLMEVEK